MKELWMVKTKKKVSDKTWDLIESFVEGNLVDLDTDKWYKHFGQTEEEINRSCELISNLGGSPPATIQLYIKKICGYVCILSGRDGGSLTFETGDIKHKEVAEHLVKKGILKKLNVAEEQEVQSAPTRADIIKRDLSQMSVYDKYRLSEFEYIRNILNSVFNLDFDVDHAQAIANPDQPGSHHPDNLQIMTRRFNAVKNRKSWDRFSFEKQDKHIRHYAEHHLQHAKELGIDASQELLDLLIKRLEIVY